MKIQEYVNNAYKEILEKNYDEIQADTALKWASRAFVTYSMIKEAEELGEGDDKSLNYLLLGEEYRHEAIEHAGSIEDEEYGPYVMGVVKDLMNDVRNEALAIVYGLTSGEEEMIEEDLEETLDEPPQEEATASKEEASQSETEDKK